MSVTTEDEVDWGERPGNSAPPSDLAAEQSVLGGMLLSQDAIGDVAEIITSEDFYKPAHGLLYETILDLFAKGEPVDPVTVVAHLVNAGQIAKVGGAHYVHTLLQTVPTAANAPYYARIVADTATQRRIIAVGTRTVQLGHSPAAAGDLSAAVDLVQQMSLGLAERQRGEDFFAIGDEVGNTLHQIDELGNGNAPKGVPTGFRDLDTLLGGGLLPGQLIIIGARPAMGKSTLAIDIARHAAIRHKLPTGVFSLEMSRHELITRILASEAGVALQDLRTGKVTEEDWAKLARSANDMDGAPLYLDDTVNQSLMEIRAKARRLKQRHDLRLIVIDYLQLMTVAAMGETRKSGNRQEEVGELSRGLKLLAKELEVPVIAASQLNRGPEQRTDKRPGLSDLRESGSVEQDADLVILLHREDYYDKESERAGEADFIVAKHRNGPTDTIGVTFQGHFTRFRDMYDPMVSSWN